MSKVVMIVGVSKNTNTPTPTYTVALKEDDKNWNEHWDPCDDEFLAQSNNVYTDGFNIKYSMCNSLNPEIVSDFITQMT